MDIKEAVSKLNRELFLLALSKAELDDRIDQITNLRNDIIRKFGDKLAK